ncbi:hypothetical protein ACMAZF_20535 (plasmid) [Psychrobium sp. nBUS_13]|uniref:hypothetical protein n=1 Tax=Psychrobium sp. nBUS_13 TaxID=3395319 RepID=UPI003EB72235
MEIGIFMKGVYFNSKANNLSSNKLRRVQYCSASLLLIILLVGLVGALPLAYAEVLSCKGHSGNTIFTDNPSHCATIKNDSAIGNEKGRKTANTAQVQTIQRCGKRVKNKHKVDYCTPRRKYYKAGTNWTIYLEKILVDADKAYADRALNKLEQNLNEIISKLPPTAARQLKKLDIYLMKGEKSGVNEGGMSYIRPGEPKNYHYLDPKWQHAIVVYSAKTLMYLDEMWTKKALMHELAHAWHISNWPQRHPPIYNAYLNAKSKGLYQNIEDYKGRKIEKAYAIKNQMEYFADLSAMYFVGGNYFPYNKNELAKYDFEGVGMIKEMWF